MNKKQISNWKIYQTDHLSYLLVNDSENVQKISGKNSEMIISVLDKLQSENNIETAKTHLSELYSLTQIESVLDWLYNTNLISLENTIENISINIIGEFSNDLSKVNQFIKMLPDKIIVKNICNISYNDELAENVDLNLIIGPLWFNTECINKISKKMHQEDADYLCIEIYKNGISLGPLLNTHKDTACLNCLEQRKFFNLNNPDVIIENISSKMLKGINQVNPFDIGNFDVNTSFIINEIEGVFFKKHKKLYNKSHFIDFIDYENVTCNVLKSPKCEICNNKIVFNPF